MPLGGDLQDDPLDEEMQVVEEDEGGRRRGPALVLLDQVVALELPDLVCALLDLLERVAAGGREHWLQGNTGHPNTVTNTPVSLPGVSAVTAHKEHTHHPGGPLQMQEKAAELPASEF